MAENYDIVQIVEKIDHLKKAALELKDISGGIQSIERNVERMMACVRALELGFVDVADILNGEELQQTKW